VAQLVIAAGIPMLAMVARQMPLIEVEAPQQRYLQGYELEMRDQQMGTTGG
jgi:hypothetical protein